jgi:hypothetical protein
MSKQTMSEIVAAYNVLAVAQGKEEVSSFKNLSAARAALATLESTPMTDEVETPEAEVETSGAPGLDTPTNSGPKYNSSGKRGPTQGIGAFCKTMIAAGSTNAEILSAVAETFPTAKTTANCVAYYRAKMKLAPVVAAADEVVEEEAVAAE